MTLGLAFFGLGTLKWWHGRRLTAEALGFAAGLFIVTALIMPDRLLPLKRVWSRWAELISRVTTPMFIGIVYFVVITPTGIVMRIMGRNQIRSRLDRDTVWVARGKDRRSDLRRQF
jgi:hypothetical protein